MLSLQRLLLVSRSESWGRCLQDSDPQVPVVCTWEENDEQGPVDLWWYVSRAEFELLSRFVVRRFCCVSLGFSLVWLGVWFLATSCDSSPELSRQPLLVTFYVAVRLGSHPAVVLGAT